MQFQVHFWLIRVSVIINCLSLGREDFRLHLEQWIDDSTGELDNDQYDSLISGEKTSRSMMLACEVGQSRRLFTSSGRLRILRLSWGHLAPTPDPNAEPPTKPYDVAILIQATSILHFEGNLTFERKRYLCDVYGFWCGSPQHNSTFDVNSVLCINPALRCDHQPDCLLWEGSSVSPDELNCKPANPDSKKLNSQGRVSLREYKSTQTTEWTSKLSWVVIAFVPAVLLCALVRICAQRRNQYIDDDFDSPVSPRSSPHVALSKRTLGSFMWSTAQRQMPFEMVTLNPAPKLAASLWDRNDDQSRRLFQGHHNIRRAILPEKPTHHCSQLILSTVPSAKQLRRPKSDSTLKGVVADKEVGMVHCWSDLLNETTDTTAIQSDTSCCFYTDACAACREMAAFSQTTGVKSLKSENLSSPSTNSTSACVQNNLGSSQQTGLEAVSE